ncbi:DEAD/DEAH box helicase family protein, partial [bacterium]|nr:DEAD/DEAH box helicase family protein [bacterium]
MDFYLNLKDDAITEICQHLGNHGWIYEHPVTEHYNQKFALFTPDLVAWIRAAWPESWEILLTKFGSKTEDQLVRTVHRELNQRGTLSVIRNGITVFGLKHNLKLAEFKPAMGIDKEMQSRYKANRLRVVRQIKDSINNEIYIDLVLYLNGISVATAIHTIGEQTIEDAINRYKKASLYKKKSEETFESILNYPSGALVHFAISTLEVQMATKLEGNETIFLPFNQGSEPGSKDCGAGNPKKVGGRQTSYLWTIVWKRESWLEILGHYVTTEQNKKNQIQRTLFPRFHQLRVTRKLVEAIKHDGPGHKYLIQHSAGSGKTHSIAWTAHFFSELNDAQNKKIFNGVIVVSDRNVIDTQLQAALKAVGQRPRDLATIQRRGGSKSQQLADALSKDKKIIVCTIQTFPYALEAARDLSANEGKSFAVIADEAHSSQTGEAAIKLKKILSPS